MVAGPVIPASVRRRFGPLTPEIKDRVQRALTDHYYPEFPEGYLESQDGVKGLADHTEGRLTVDREWFVPWVSSVRPLEGLDILEIGCGTGSSTVALAEQGARVAAVDIHEASLRVAAERIAAYGLDADLVQGNGIDAVSLFPGRKFDLILFYASIEHMTHEERIHSMRNTWEALSPGALWCLTDTPNRLWWLDLHTSKLPFFQWLPDDLAVQYTRFSPRPIIRDHTARENGHTEPRDLELELIRRGRGVSYHEFEVAMAPISSLHILSCKRLFYRRQKPLRAVKQRWSPAGRFEETMVALAPEIPRAFLLPSLDLVLQK